MKMRENETTIGATMVRFRRCDKDGKNVGKWEDGIAIARAIGVSDIYHITDVHGKLVEHIWDYDMRHSRGCFEAIVTIPGK
jgi:hypothetical protein